MFRSIRRKPASLFIILEQFDYLTRQCLDIQRIDQARRIPKHFLQRRYSPGNHRRAASHRFQRRQPKAFVKRWVNEYTATRVESAQLIITEITGKTDPIVYSGMLDKRKHFIHQPSFATSNDKLWAQRRLSQYLLECLQQRQQILSRFECANEQQKIIFDRQP